MWEKNQHASDDGLTSLLPIHLLSRLHGKSAPWKWLRGNNTLQREINVNGKTWPSLCLSQVITFGVYTLHWQIASSLRRGKPTLPHLGSSSLPGWEKLRSTVWEQMSINPTNSTVKMPKCAEKHQGYLTLVTSKKFLPMLHSLKLAFTRFRCCVFLIALLLVPAPPLFFPSRF